MAKARARDPLETSNSGHRVLTICVTPINAVGHGLRMIVRGNGSQSGRWSALSPASKRLMVPRAAGVFRLQQVYWPGSGLPAAIVGSLGNAVLIVLGRDRHERAKDRI